MVSPVIPVTSILLAIAIFLEKVFHILHIQCNPLRLEEISNTRLKKVNMSYVFYIFLLCFY